MIITVRELPFQSGDLVLKSPEDVLSVIFDWRPDLVDSVIVDSSFTLTTVRPAVDTDLIIESEDLLAGQQEARVSLSGGRIGSMYLISNLVATNESPAEIFRSGIRILVER